LRAEAEDSPGAAEFAGHLRQKAKQLRQNRIRRLRWGGFKLLNGETIDDPNRLVDLIVASQGKDSDEDLHYLVEGTRWLLENPEITLFPNSKAAITLIRFKAIIPLIFSAQGRQDSRSEKLTIQEANWVLQESGVVLDQDNRAKLLSIMAFSLLARSDRKTTDGAVRDIENALAALSSALEIGKAEGDDRRCAYSEFDKGRCYHALAERNPKDQAVHDFDLALKSYQSALEFFTPESDAHMYASVQANKGLSLISLGQKAAPKSLELSYLNKAGMCITESIRIWHRLDNKKEYSQAVMNLGNLFTSIARILTSKERLENLRTAVEAYDDALLFRSEIDYPHDHARTQMNRGAALSELAEYGPDEMALAILDEALKAVTKSIEIWTPELDARHHCEAQLNRASTALRVCKVRDIPAGRLASSLLDIRQAAVAVMSLQDPKTGCHDWLVAQRYLATACRGSGDIVGERAALEEALDAGRRGILGSSDTSERTLLAQRIAGAGDALGLLLLRSDADAAAALAAVGSGRGIQLSADLFMARLEVDPDLFPLREALRTLQAAREDLARVEREVMVLRGQVEQSRQLMERSDDENTAAEAIAEAEFAQSQLSNLQAERAAALSSFEAARSVYETGLSAAGLGLDPEPPSMDEIVDALPEGGVLAVPIPGADGDGGALLILGRGPDGTPEAAWSEVPGLSEDAGRELLFGEPWKEGCDEDDLAPGWFDAYNDLKGRLAKSGGVASPHGPAQTALDRAVHGMGRRLWDLIMGPLDHALRAIGAAPGAEVVMMPPGRLAALPLAAAHPEPEVGAAIRPFLADWALSLVPSPQALIAAAGRIAALEVTEGTQPARLLCVTTPKEFAPNPAADLAPRGTCREIEGPDATPEEVRAALAGHRYVAFLCHGHWNPQDPGTSGLALAGPLDEAGRETVAMLTMGDLQRPGVATGDARSWLMMACETAPVGLDAPDEFAGLAVRLAGEVPAVVGTLYPVLMGHAALLGRAVLALQMGPRRLSPAQALRQAQLTAMEGGTPALEALAAEAIGPGPTTSASVSAPVVPTPAVMSSAASFGPDSRRALGMPRDRDARALFDDFDEDDDTPVDDTATEPEVDGHDPDDWTTHIPAHWAAYTTYGR